MECVVATDTIVASDVAFIVVMAVSDAVSAARKSFASFKRTSCFAPIRAVAASAAVKRVATISSSSLMDRSASSAALFNDLRGCARREGVRGECPRSVFLRGGGEGG